MTTQELIDQYFAAYREYTEAYSVACGFQQKAEAIRHDLALALDADGMDEDDMASLIALLRAGYAIQLPPVKKVQP